MRFVRKGGVWKNTEDEILKAAVMKYGKNQWARVSSLLVRKSAKQCKARWYEWLDPSVKKTEWSREEQEKLLHLAKIMPSQWRSIAAIVGRTPSQCLEHYARLLDAAQAQEEIGAGGGAGAVSAREDLRKLRPGEIDPHPETKPARPDPVDMDEDEKEMLSEARARLANTKGKKAKRKAREKQLEEARRLATLQKRRELKAAGIEYRGPRQGLTKRKRKEIDYNAEIPFEARAPKGFFDTTQEDDEARRRRSEQKFIGKTLTEIEGRRRDDIEAEERKKDAKRQKLLRKHDLPSYVARISALNDPQLKKTRSKMQLPSPQISDADLRQLASTTGVAASASAAASSSSMEPNTPSTMGMRTPRVPESADRLVVEAQNLIALQSSDTPLVGGDNAPLRQSDFQGATPTLHSVVSTPNILKQKQLQQHRQQQQTPVRDELSINTGSHAGFDDDDDDEERTSAAYLRRRQRESRERLRDGLLQLPRPKGDYELALPAPDHDHDESQEPKEPKEEFVPDAADVRSWKQQQRLDEEEAAFRRLSSVLQRPELPRPKPRSSKDVTRDGVEALVYDELENLVRHDAKHSSLDAFSDAQMASARSLVDAELTSSPMEPFDVVADLAAFENAFDEFRFLPSRSGVGRWSQATVNERKTALVQELALRDAELSREVKRGAKAERKYEVLCGGYDRRQRELATLVGQAVKDVERAHIDLACFETLRDREAEAVPARIRRLREELDDVKQKELALNNSYRELQLRSA